MKRKLILLVLSLFVLATGDAYAQGGQVFGRTTDSSGAVMSGVKVTLSSPALLQPLTATTSDSGTYQFPGLAIGNYSVKFEVTGYRTVLHQNVDVEIGFNAEINAAMQAATVEQSVAVTTESPVVDTQSTALAVEIDQMRMQQLPSARNQFNLAEESPGVTAASKDVGGSFDALGPSFVVRGADFNQTKFYMDGVDISPAGSSAGFWMDFDSIQEVRINAGGADATVMSSGMTIDMVSKSGSNKFHGSGHMYSEGQTFESNNLDPALRAATSLNGAGPGNPLQHFTDWGVETGGPILRDRLWFWGDYSWQIITLGDYGTYNTDSFCTQVAANQLNYSYRTVRSCTHSDPSYLKHLAYKVGWQVFHNNTFTFTNRYDVKEQQTFGFTPLRPVNTTLVVSSPIDSASRGPRFWDAGWPTLWKFDDQDVITDRWLVDVAFEHYVKNSNQDLQNPGLHNVQVQFEQSTGQFNNSYTYTRLYQPSNKIVLMTSYFLPAKWGGDHTFKFGFENGKYENNASSTVGGGAQAIFNSASTLPPFSTSLAVNFYRPLLTDAFLYQRSAYIQDTFKHKRITLNLGFRYDRQDDAEIAESVPASQYQGQTTMNGATFNYLPAVQYPGARGGVVWNTFSPRLGMTFDIFGSGKTVLKASYDRYHDQRFAGQLADTYDSVGSATNNSAGTVSFVQFPWHDLNADGVVQMNEVDTTTVRAFGGNYNPNNPSQTISSNTVSPNIRAPKTDEFVAGVSQEIGAGFGVSLNYIYRKYSNFIWSRLNGISSANYVPCQTSPTAPTPCSVTNPNTSVTTTTTLPATTCPTTTAPTGPTQCAPVTYFVPNIPTPTSYTLDNQPGYSRTYQGLELLVRKRMLKNWMLVGSFTYQGAWQHWQDANSYQDPTNIVQQNGAQYAPSVTNYTIPVNVNARWISRIGGQYRLPWYGIAISATNDFRQGFAILNTINVSSRANQAGAISVLIDSPVALRYPTLEDLDIRVNKTFHMFHDRFKLEPAVDLYNVFNGNAIVARQANQNSSIANRIGAVEGPRIVRIGILASF